MCLISATCNDKLYHLIYNVPLTSKRHSNAGITLCDGTFSCLNFQIEKENVYFSLLSSVE